MSHASPRPRRPHAAAAWIAILAAAALTGCVVTSRTTRPSTGFTSQSKPTATAATPTTPAAAPSISPRSSRVSTSFMELGTVPYDGQVLPLTSPDGRFIAVEVGNPPTWPTLLAIPDAEVPANTSVRAYSLPFPTPAAATDQPAASPSVATLISWPKPVAGGILLGRSSDSTGFLVEAPQADGSRWIGRIDWLKGSLRWLVQGGEVNSHATLGLGGELVYSTRAVAANPPPPDLVVNTVGGDLPLRLSTPNVGYVFPFFSGEPGIVYSFALSQAGMDVVAVKIPKAGEAPVLTIVGRQSLARSIGVALLYQATASTQTPLPGPGGAAAAIFDKALYFHPEQGRIMLFDRRGLKPILLPRGSIAAAPVPQAPGRAMQGFLVTAPRSGLEYVEIETKSEIDNENPVAVDRTEGIRIINEPFLPRLTSDPAWPFLLIGPSQSGESQSFRLRRLRLGAE